MEERMRLSRDWACGDAWSRVPESSFCTAMAAIKSLAATSSPVASRPASIWQTGAAPSTMSRRLCSTLEKAGVYHDDSQIVRLSIEKGEVVAGGKTLVQIRNA